MPIPCYLALTGAEFANIRPLPTHCAWMACHYDCYTTGLSNLPQSLPPNSMIIVNDRIPPDRHDPQRILAQLQALVETLRPDSILLDFQRPDMPLNKSVAQVLTRGLACPVGVTAIYGKALDCPVFLEPVPLHIPLESYIAPWAGRRLWLEIAKETRRYTVTAQGCVQEAEDDVPLDCPVFSDEQLFCHYHTKITNQSAVFTLQRTDQDLDAMLHHAAGIEKAVGLYQQLGHM